MEYFVVYEEVIKRTNRIKINVDTVVEGQHIVEQVCGNESTFNHPDDIVDAMRDAGAEVIEVREGTPKCRYQIIT